MASRAHASRVRPWPALRVGLYGAIVGALLGLFLTFAAALGGGITGLAFWGRLAAGALAGFIVGAGLVALSNRVRGA